MPTEAIVCPTCGAADSSRADAHGLHTCVYCGVRYRLTGGVATRVIAGAAAAAPPANRAAAVVGALVAILVIAGAGVGFAFMRAAPRAPAPSATPLVSIPATPGAGGAATPSASVSVAAPGPTTATFELDHKRPSVGASFYAIGWVTNTSDHAIDKAKVVVVLRDAAGKEVGTGFGFTNDDEIAAGERVPISVLVKDPPAFASLTGEVDARPPSYARARIDGLRIEAGEVKKDSWRYVVDGKVHHEGTVPARFVQIEVRAFDAAGELLGLDTTYADAEVLAPGASARWNASPLGYEAEPKRFEFVVRAMPATQ